MKNTLTQKPLKAVLALISVCILLLAVSIVAWAEEDRVTKNIQKYPDVPSSHWAATFITRLTYEGAINGYPDGTFGPGNNITRAEFVTLVVGALLGKPEAPPAGQHWAANIMKAAENNNLLDTGEFALDTWNTPIVRQEMAKIMARATQFVQKEAPAANTSVYTSKITDFATIPEGYRSYVAQAYAKGIVTGYPEGNFGGDRQATRAEAATMLVRLIDPCFRLCEITFDPATDVAADGRMKTVKAEQYLMKNLQSLRFYEENGKFYFEGYVTEVPEGFVNELFISVVFQRDTGLPVANYSSDPYPAEKELPMIGPFKEEIKGIDSLIQIRYIEVTMMIDAIRHTNTTFDRVSYEVCWIFDSGSDNRIDAVNQINASKETHKFYDLSKVFTWRD